MTRKLSVLAATCALALGAFGGTASADKPSSPGCEGRDTAFVAQGAGGDSNGLANTLDELGLTREQFEAAQDLFCAEPVS